MKKEKKKPDKITPTHRCCVCSRMIGNRDTGTSGRRMCRGHVYEKHRSKK